MQPEDEPREDVQSLAALVNRQSLDLNTYAAFLINSLDGALPAELVDIRRKSALFGRHKPDAPILCVTVHLGQRRFVLQRPDPTRTPTAHPSAPAGHPRPHHHPSAWSTKSADA